MIKIQNVRLLDVIPPNLQNDPTVAAAASTIDVELQAITASIARITYMDRLDTITEAEIDELAWQFHVDFYDTELPIEQKRELVKKSFAWHKRKGTPSAVEELIATVFGDGIVEEWFEYGGNPFYFRVITSNFSATTEHALRFMSAVNSVKNARSWLDTVIIRLVEETPIYWGTAVYFGDHIKLIQEG